MIRTAFGIALLAIVMFAASSGPGSVSAGGGCHQQSTLTDITGTTGTTVDMVGACFEPTVIRVNKGGAVTWTNNDEQVHTVTGAGGVFGNMNEIAADDSVSYTFADTGVFPYYCVFHPAMVGAVVVGDGVPADGDAAASIPQAADSGDGGTSVSTIAAAVALGGAAVGLVGTRVLHSRRSRTVETM